MPVKDFLRLGSGKIGDALQNTLTYFGPPSMDDDTDNGDDFYQAIADGILQVLKNDLVEVDPVKQPGLYKLPDKINLPIIEQVNLKAITDFLGGLNIGRGLKVKESNIVIINKGGGLKDFYLNMSGYCFLHELLPDKKNWDHPKHKYWVVQVPGTEKQLLKMLEFVTKFLSEDDQSKKGYSKEIKKSGFSKELQNYCMKYPLFTVKDIQYILESIELKRPPKKFTLDDPLEQEIFEKTGILWFQGLTLDQGPGYREIQFGKYDKKSETKDNPIAINFRKEMSAVFVASFFPYGFVVPEAEDMGMWPTRIALAIRAQCINPYIAHVISSDPFGTMSLLINNAVSEVIRENYVHILSMEIAIKNKKIKKAVNILNLIQQKVLAKLQPKDVFFGFDFGFTDSADEIIQIVDIDIVGPKAEELKAKAAETAKKDIDRNNDLLDSQNKVKIEENNAKANSMPIIKEMEAHKIAYEMAKKDNLVTTFKEYYDMFVAPRQLENQIDKLNVPSVFTDPLKIVEDLSKKKTA